MGVVFFALAGVGIIVAVCLSYYYMGAKPRLPQPEFGITYEFNVHGTIVYLTECEYLLHKYIFFGSFYSGLVAFILRAITLNST